MPNIPDREGVDPHGPDASETPYGLAQIAAFLGPAGHVIAVCGEVAGVAGRRTLRRGARTR